MADEDKESKTEEPTQRRLDEARREGDVAKSQDFAGFVLLLGGVIALAAGGGPAAHQTAQVLSAFLEQAGTLPTDGPGLTVVFRELSMKIGLAFAGVFAALLIAAIAGHVLQHGVLWAPKKLAPKLDKLDMSKGAERLFGPQAFSTLGKSVLKMVVLGAVALWALWSTFPGLESIAMIAPQALGGIMVSATIKATAGVLAAAGMFALADFIMARQAFMKRMRMSREDLKEEYRQSEGDPQIKMRIRRLRMERARRRMMAEVPGASVVLMNPTHYAVALKYKVGETPAPVCVAKGVDAVALRIRAVAEEHGVPIVEDPPLARALHKSAELDAPIPAEHYQAVAKVIGYVMRLAQSRRDGRRKA